MASDRRIIISPDRASVVAENGPMRLVLRAWRSGRFRMDPVLEAARFAFSCLEEVAGHLDALKGPAAGIDPDGLPGICRNMCDSAKAIGDGDLTPMASVAGAIADAVADHLFRLVQPEVRSRGSAGEGTKVIVDNGGDLAIRLSGGERATVGLRPDLRFAELSHTMELTPEAGSREAGRYGVNTSGMGGRSFTRGIASAATVLAGDSCTADAAATAIANARRCEDENIVRVPAGTLDPFTDIPDIPVTVQAAGLGPGTVETALRRAWEKAEHLRTQGLIQGAFIVCGGHMALTRRFSDLAGLVPVPGNGLIHDGNHQGSV